MKFITSLSIVLNTLAAILAQASLTSPSKATLSSPMKRRLSPEPFDEEFDTENMDPNILFSPSKKSKAIDGTPNKVFKFVPVDTPKLTITPANAPFLTTGSASTNNIKPKLKPLSVSVPTSTTTTPIAHSRGSPKHKRVGLLSNKRRFSSSPFRRVDPPSFNFSTPSLPFTIDAAISGTVTSYKPHAKPNEAEAVETAMPESWFFTIHADTAEDEAANLMEHSAATLDISSDDDGAERRRKRDLEKGKENVPPADWTGPVRSVRGSAEVHRGICDGVKRDARAAVVEDELAMVEDRVALKEMLARDFYPEGLDEGSVELVREDVKQKPSDLAKDATFDFVPESEDLRKIDEEIFVRPDTP